MPSLNHLPIYVAEVTETGLGDSGREIKAGNEWLSEEADNITPALDGLMKLPPPAVGEKVLILQVDSTNLYRYYIPIRSSFSALSDDSTKVQIESEGDLEIEGTAIKIGSGATEAAVLGDTLKQWLTDLNTAIQAITVLGNIGVPTGPPINAAQFAALTAQLINILSTKVTIE